MFRKPQPQTLKADHTSRVSRCAVCLRRQVIEDNNSRLRPFTAARTQYIPQAQPPAVNPLASQQPTDYQRQRQRNRTRGPHRGRVPYNNRGSQQNHRPDEANEFLDH